MARTFQTRNNLNRDGGFGAFHLEFHAHVGQIRVIVLPNPCQVNKLASLVAFLLKYWFVRIDNNLLDNTSSVNIAWLHIALRVYDCHAEPIRTIVCSQKWKAILIRLYATVEIPRFAFVARDEQEDFFDICLTLRGK